MPDVYNRNRVTKKGYNLLAESIATKKPITFTKVVVGDGDDTGLDIDTMTGLVSPKMELPIGNGEKGGDGEYVIQAVLSNKTLEHSFFPKEVGLFAKCGDGEEVLYSYSNGGSNVGLMPDKNTPINAEIYNIRTKIGNATNITFVTSDDTYVTKGELTKHNTDPDAHGGLLQKVKTELATHNTDILSHPAITTMIAKILGATNWQENPVATLKDIKTTLGMGGIVAQRLEENGFVKFANGFTIQWGQFKENQANVLYLISYIEIYGTVTMMKDEPKRLYEASVRANNITITGFELHSGYVGNHIAKAINNGFWINIGRS